MDAVAAKKEQLQEMLRKDAPEDELLEKEILEEEVMEEEVMEEKVMEEDKQD